jgi:hypothetical protein
MIDITSIIEMSETVEALPTTSSAPEGMYTPYRIAEVINTVLRQLDDTEYNIKAVAPQMMYTYKKTGRISGNKEDKYFTEEQVQNFVARFIKSRKI